MNAKTAKLLRKVVRESSPVGEPKVLHAGVKQMLTPRFNPNTGRTEQGFTVGVINHPDSFRGRYRNLKSGRTTDRKKIVSLPTREPSKKKVNFTSTITDPKVEKRMRDLGFIGPAITPPAPREPWWRRLAKFFKK